MNRLRVMSYWVVALLCVCVVSCQTTFFEDYTVEGTQYGVTRGVFHGRWWNYYERGCSFLAGNFLTEAERDFRTALESRARDSWQARTYGLHFVEYFPNRELGITLYKQGRLSEAESYLRTSLSHVDTDRARYYLDLIVKERLSRGEITDTSAPSLKAELVELSPEVKKGKSATREKSVISEANTVLRVYASDDIGLDRLTVNQSPIVLRYSETSVLVDMPVDVREGDLHFTVTARDLAGKETEFVLSTRVDLTGPNIGIFRPVEPLVTNAPETVIEGVIVDDTGITEVLLDGQPLDAQASGETRREIRTVVRLKDGENVFVLTARDVAGNETRTAIKVFRGEMRSDSAQNWLWAQNRLRKSMQLASSATGYIPYIEGSVLRQSDEVVIDIKVPKPDRPSRHNRAVRVAGEVMSTAPIKTLLINQEPYLLLTGAPKEVFNKRIPLPPEISPSSTAVVKLAVEASDAEGRIAKKDMEVKVEPVVINSNETKMSIAVLAVGGRVPGDRLGDDIRLVLEDRVKRQGRFLVLDRQNLQQILTEQQLSAGLSDPVRALDIGRLVPVQVFVVGELFARGENSAELKIRLINTETSEVLSIFDAFIDNISDLKQVEGKCDVLARQLSEFFPRLSGEVIDYRGSGARIDVLYNWSEQDGVRPGMYALILYEAEPAWTDPDTGMVTQPAVYEVLYRSRIINVTETSARGQIITDTTKPAEGVSIEKGLPSITM